MAKRKRDGCNGHPHLYRIARVPCTLPIPSTVCLNKPVLTIGREQPKVDMWLDSAKKQKMISRLHARMVWSPSDGGNAEDADFARGSWRIEDNKSINGLFVNSVRTLGAEMNDGDEIILGDGANVTIGGRKEITKSEFVYVFRKAVPENGGDDEPAAKRRVDEAARRREKEEEEEEERRRLREEEEEALRKKREEEEEALRKKREEEEEALKKKREEEEEALKKKREEAEAELQRQKAELDSLKEAQARMRREAEEAMEKVEAERKALEEERERAEKERGARDGEAAKEAEERMAKILEAERKLEEEKSKAEEERAKAMAQLEADRKKLEATSSVAGGEEIQEEFSCCICRDFLVYATTVGGCAHVFCEDCLLQWRVEGCQGKETCPSCRTPITSITRARAYDKAVELIAKKAPEEERAEYEQKIKEKEANAKLCRRLEAEAKKQKGKAFLDIRRQWSNVERATFDAGLKKYKGSARTLYCELAQLTPALVQSASMALLKTIAKNMNVAYAPGVQMNDLKLMIMRTLYGFKTS